MTTPILPHEQTGPVIPFGRLTPPELELIAAIGKRGGAMVATLMRERKGVILESNDMIQAMDIATVHLARPLDLRAFLCADDLSFLEDFISIQTNIDRTCGTFPFFVPLRYALKTN